MSKNSQRRVVVTAMGVVSPIGIGADVFWKALTAGKSNVTAIDHFDASEIGCRIASRLNDFNAQDYFDKKQIRRGARYIQFAVIAAREAFERSGLDMQKEDPWRVGSYMGCGVGGMDVIEEQIRLMIERGAKRVSPFLIPRITSNMTSGHVAIELGLKGPNVSLASACASAAHAIGESMRIIQRGDADMMFTGGTEAAICLISMAGFSNMHALSTRNDDPNRASRPFDRNRDGFVLGEGAGVLVLEELEHARARGADILAELSGYGATDDAFHITAPDEDGAGAAMAMELAMKDASLAPQDVQYINAHGTSTPINDRVETMAIKSAFKDHAYKLAISSNKSMIGHLLGAAGAVEAVSTVMTLRDGVIPPTINHEEPDPELDLDYTPNEAREAKVSAAISNSLGFGGHNATLAFRAWNGS